MKDAGKIKMNHIKFFLVFLLSMLLITSCSSSPTSQNIGETLATGLFLGGLATYPKDDEENADDDKNKAYGLMAAGVLTYYLAGKLNNYNRKKEAERKVRERWVNNNCSNREKQIKINKIKLAEHYKAEKMLSQSKNICSSLVGEKPLDACIDSEKKMYGVAICSNKIGGCEKAYELFPNSFSKIITSHSCAVTLSKLKKNEGFDKLDESIRSLNIAMYDEIAKQQSEAGNKLKAVFAKLVANHQRSEQFEDCVYKVSNNCSSRYEKWKKSHTRIDQSCIANKMRGWQGKILAPNLLTKIQKREIEFNSLCK